MSDKKEVSSEDLQALLKQNEELIKENARLAAGGAKAISPNDTRGILKRMSTSKRSCVIMFVDNVPVVGFKNRGSNNKPTYLYEKPDPADPKHNILYVDLLLYGNDKPLTVPHKEFLDGAEKVRCNILSTEKQEWVIEQGLTSKKEVDGYRMVEIETDVPVEVKGEIRYLTVEIPKPYSLPDGKTELRIHENYVNINQAADGQVMEMGEMEQTKE